MRTARIVVTSIVFLVCGFGHAALEKEQVTFTGKVLDSLGQPVAAAKVTVYEMHSNGIAGNIFLRQATQVSTWLSDTSQVETTSSVAPR